MNLDTNTADSMLDAYLRDATVRRTWWDEVKTTDRNNMNNMEFKFAVANWYNKANNYFSYDGANTWFNAGALIKNAAEESPLYEWVPADELRNSFYNSRPCPIGFAEERLSGEPSQELEDFLAGFPVHTTGGDE